MVGVMAVQGIEECVGVKDNLRRFHGVGVGGPSVHPSAALEHGVTLCDVRGGGRGVLGNVAALELLASAARGLGRWDGAAAV